MLNAFWAVLWALQIALEHRQWQAETGPQECTQVQRLKRLR